jgi:hypothetical protein
MGYHSFSLDPRTILGVSPSASTEEIHEAYRLKSKKHHPDLGGDEWAFRMVTRAYEVLKTTSVAPTLKSHVNEEVWAEPDPGGTARPGNDLEELRVVDIELIWTRFEANIVTRLLSAAEEIEETLSVCLVISWPATWLVTRVAEFDSAGVILHGLIDVFDDLHGSSLVVAGRSRIEDGRFVGWLSYPSVVAAQDAFLSLRGMLMAQGLTVKLQTRDERVPFAWFGRSEEPVMSAPAT